MSLALGLGMAGSALASLAGGLATNAANANLNYRNRLWHEEMWKKQNEYNSPSSVLARYARAGISVNPNYLVTGGYDGGLASHVGNPAVQPYTNPMEGVNLFDFISRNKQIDNETKVAESQEAKNYEEADLASSNKDLADSNKEKVDWENIITSQTYESVIDSAKENLEILKNKNLISGEEYKIKMAEYDKELERVREARASADVKEEEVNTQKAQTGYIESQTKTEETKQTLNYAMAAAQRASEKYNLSMANQIDALTGPMKQELLSRVKLNYNNAIKALQDAGLSYWEAKKVVIEADLAIKNGEVSRLYTKEQTRRLKTSQRYGTSMIGAALGFLIDGAQQYNKVFKPIIKQGIRKSKGKSKYGGADSRF